MDVAGSVYPVSVREFRNRLVTWVALLWLLLGAAPVHATDLVEIGKDKPWHVRLGIRGYTQIRYNRLGESNDQLKNEQADRSMGKDGGFSIRRARVVLFGDLGDFLSVYFQPEFASLVGDANHVVQVRDWWADLFLDWRKNFRFRAGQQKVRTASS